jgi:hypothetical protein
MKKVLLFFMLLSLTVACTAQSDTPNVQAEVPANRARVDNKMDKEMEVFIQVEDGGWRRDTLQPNRNYINLNNCGIPNRLCKKELAVCTGDGTENCHITELKGGIAYFIIWDRVTRRWLLEEYKKD